MISSRRGNEDWYPAWEDARPAGGEVSRAQHIGRAGRRRKRGRRLQPVAFQPGHLGNEGQATLRKGSQPGPSQWRQVRPPGPVTVGLNVTGSSDGEGTERGQVDGLVVNTAEIAVPLNSQLHGRLRCWRDGCGSGAAAAHL